MHTRDLMWVAFVCAGMFFIFGFIFLILKENASKFITGFNTKTAEEKTQYDTAKLCRDFRNHMFLVGIIFLVGGLLVGQFGVMSFVVALAVNLVLIFKKVHFNDEKAYGKYRKN
ncbi:MAG: DUF3784 domain-containing protein [Clostridia bacterium]|nr:DUF3784 domain-containing protein [Clostridia bacterium]